MSSLIPQALVTLSPEGELQIELPGRKIIPLSQANAGRTLARILAEQARKIKNEQVRNRTYKQPDWRLIAKHPQVEIRERLGEQSVQRVLAKDSRIKQDKSSKSLEELDL